MDRPKPDHVFDIVKKSYYDADCVTMTSRMIGKEPLYRIVIRPIKDNKDSDTTFADQGERVTVALHEKGIILVYYKNDDLSNEGQGDITKTSRTLMYADCKSLKSLTRTIINYANRYIRVDLF